MVNPQPAFIKRIENAEADHGNQLGNWVVWPTISPTVKVERGEKLQLILRVRPMIGDGSKLELKPLTTDAVKCAFSPEAKGSGYLLNVEIQPSEKAGLLSLPIILNVQGAQEEIRINLAINVIADNLTATPKSLDLGEVPLSRLAGALRSRGRVGIKKIVGSFQIKSLTTSLAFLTAQAQMVIEGSGYLVALGLDESRQPEPGEYQSVLRIETDDRRTPVIEIPIRLRVVKD